MDKRLPSGEVSLGILVHTSARVTYAEDEIYRKQARNLGAYLTGRTQVVKKDSNLAVSSAIVKQTPTPRNADICRKNEHDPGYLQQPDRAIAESVLVSFTYGFSASSGLPPRNMRLQPVTPEPHMRSPASSIVAVLGGTNTEPITSTNLVDSALKHPDDSKTGSQVLQDTNTDSCVICSAEGSLVTPDSAGFILRSPTYIRARKRKQSMPAEEPRKVRDTGVLSECSPNKSKKRRLSDTTKGMDRDAKPSSQHALQNGSGIWLGSVAQLSNSTVDVPTPCPPPLTSSLTSVASSKTHIPPWPKTSTERYSTNKVGVFAYIARNSGLCTAYKPKYTKRSLEPLERGYWHLNIPYSWSTESQDDFWSLLRDMIVGGKCGWGNWIEHIDNRNAKSVQQKDAAPNRAQGSIDEVRFWCWGEVVREMWLAILMASRKQTMRLGMAWFDSCGKVVVQMR